MACVEKSAATSTDLVNFCIVLKNGLGEMLDTDFTQLVTPCYASYGFAHSISSYL